MSNVYPAGIKPAEGSFMKTSAFFRKQMIKMVGGVLLFFLSYCLLLSLAVILALGCIAGGILLIIHAPPDYARFITLVLGLVMVTLGILTVMFLIKFLFRRQKPANPYRIEIFVEEHPQLFAFIRQIADETKTRFPKRVFLIPDVNAGVFYNSSFFSMFWPSDKNLEIGIGLINSLNISEFKMALAHEFGHFAQRSMAPGSYVYVLNKVVYNMLYENDNWNMAIIKWSGAGFGFINILLTRVTLYIARGIQFPLRKMYNLLNRQYMLLCREIEYHADSVALSICGTQTAISTMRRMEMSIFCFENCLQELPGLAAENLKFLNIYEAHIAMIRYYASQNNLPLDGEQLPLITDDYFRTFLRSRVLLRDQAASHPTREERERRYLAADIPSQTISDSAWTLFNDREQLQEGMSALIYQLEVPHSDLCEWYTTPDFIADLEVKQLLYALPAEFHEYYNNRPFPVIDTDNLEPLSAATMEQLSFTSLYIPENGLRIRRFFRNSQDAETLQAIADGDIQTGYFEFAGVQHQASHARIELKELQKELEQDREWLAAQDHMAFRYHYTVALLQGQEAAHQLVEQYLLVYRHEQKASRLSDIVVKIMHSISIIFGSNGISVRKSLPFFETLQQGSNELREFLEELSADSIVTSLWQPLLQAQIAHFLSHHYIYLLENEPVEVEIENIHAIISVIQEHYNNSIQLIKKALLEMMLPVWDQ
ncbi:Zn-dependent protease with chaperone function [Chitinophaga sp. CF118]|uniref:M48 family metallopeptidase n=1 Tax=Chitinophaga sp. CF118 TaxID=1884367 RepID=UPI0008F0EA3B|nr:M48 family metallopeptidase [Chitinophaga sp. CF118]SFD14648.1 Zn-dependent protease with chaperone function [Chitinophaga sp. CF118]